MNPNLISKLMLYLITIFTYLLILIGLGIYKAKFIKTQDDFSVAGRTLTPWVLVGTMLATWIGTGSILGNAGKTYEIGIAALMLPIGGVLGIFILTRIAGKVRAYEKFTVPEILGDRFGSEARVLSVFALVIAYMVIVSYQFNAGGAVLHTVLTDSSGDHLISLQTGTIISAIFIIAYTMLAGLVSVAYTDVGNGLIMTLSLLISFPILWIKAGGWSGIEVAFSNMGSPEKMDFFGQYSLIDIINFCLPSFLLVLGDANMYQRFFASKDVESARKATTVLVGVVLLIELLIIASAWVSSSMISDVENGRHVLIYAAHQLLPPILGAIMMTTIIGIIISTADSFLLVPATTLIRDIYIKYINNNVSDKKIVLLSRLLVLILGMIAYIVSIGFSKSSSFFERALYAYTIYGAAITPVLMAALFWKKASKVGAIISIISGTITTLIWKEFSMIKFIIPGNIYNTMDEVLPAILVSLFGLIFGSIFFPDNKP